MERSKQDLGILHKIKHSSIRMLIKIIEIICIRVDKNTINISQTKKTEILKTHLQCLESFLKI